MKQFLNSLLGTTGYRVAKDSPLLFHGQDLNRLYIKAPWIRYWIELKDAEREQISPFLWASKAQLGQDLFAFNQSQKRDNSLRHYFVDIGASDGIRFSNTWLLEKHLGWHGIAAEPARCWREDLQHNRKCIIDTRAVFHSSGENLLFLDVSNAKGYRELSSLASASNSDDRQSQRQADPTTYSVETISLTDLLITHSAPSYIDFLSIDTEGSELAILQHFDWNNFSFGSICVEHNYNKRARSEIFNLLSSRGYKRVHTYASAWDDWYVSEVSAA